MNSKQLLGSARQAAMRLKFAWAKNSENNTHQHRHQLINIRVASTRTKNGWNFQPSKSCEGSDTYGCTRSLQWHLWCLHSEDGREMLQHTSLAPWKRLSAHTDVFLTISLKLQQGQGLHVLVPTIWWDPSLQLRLPNAVTREAGSRQAISAICAVQSHALTYSRAIMNQLEWNPSLSQ